MAKRTPARRSRSATSPSVASARTLSDAPQHRAVFQPAVTMSAPERRTASGVRGRPSSTCPHLSHLSAPAGTRPHLLAPAGTCRLVEEYRKAGKVRLVLNNAFAFGGLNAALVLRAWES